MQSQQAAFDKFKAASGRSLSSGRDFRGGERDRRGEGGRDNGNSGPMLPELHSIHRGKITKVEDFGAFVEIPGFQKQGLVHKSQASKHFTSSIADVVQVNDKVWVKVTSLQENKIALSMKYCDQGDGTDLDHNLVNMASDSDRKRTQGGFTDKAPISIGDDGVFKKATCKKCGSSGHLAIDCFSGGEKFELVGDDEPEDIHITASKPKKERSFKDIRKEHREKNRHGHHHRDREESSGKRDRRDKDSDRGRDRSSRLPHHHDRETSSSKSSITAVDSVQDALALLRARKEKDRSSKSSSHVSSHGSSRSSHRRTSGRSRSRSRSPRRRSRSRSMSRSRSPSNRRRHG